MKSQLFSIVRYLKAANGGIKVTSFRAKFIERQSESKQDPKSPPDLVYLGISDQLFIDINGTPLESVHTYYLKVISYMKDVRDCQDYVFSTDVIKPCIQTQKIKRDFDPAH